jgi:hypothetical protein
MINKVVKIRNRKYQIKILLNNLLLLIILFKVDIKKSFLNILVWIFKGKFRSKLELKITLKTITKYGENKQ